MDERTLLSWPSMREKNATSSVDSFMGGSTSVKYESSEPSDASPRRTRTWPEAERGMSQGSREAAARSHAYAQCNGASQ
jgi:hypothetical protein